MKQWPKAVSRLGFTRRNVEMTILPALHIDRCQARFPSRQHVVHMAKLACNIWKLERVLFRSHVCTVRNCITARNIQTAGRAAATPEWWHHLQAPNLVDSEMARCLRLPVRARRLGTNSKAQPAQPSDWRLADSSLLRKGGQQVPPG